MTMTILLFYYTLLILLVSITAAAFCLSGYLVSHRRALAIACAGFLSYFFDVALVFQDDFLLRGAAATDAAMMQGSPESVYFVGSQLPSVVTGAGILMALWLCICDFFEVRSKAFKAAPGIVFVVGSLAVYFLIDNDSLGLFLFYGMRSVVIIWMLLYVAARYISSPDGIVRERLWRYRLLYGGQLFFAVAVVVENAVFMFFIDPELVSSGSVPFSPSAISPRTRLCCGAPGSSAQAVGGCSRCTSKRRLRTIATRPPRSSTTAWHRIKTATAFRPARPRC